MRKQRINVRILFLLFHLLSLLLLSRCIITSNITLSNPLLQGQTITSPDQNFELGFFTPTNFSNQYVGIWYKDVSPQKVVWVANREKPVLHAPASLQIGKDGDLRLVDGKQETIWSAGVGHNLINESIAILLDGGNFILKEFVSSKNLWESSQHPSDTLLPGKWTFFNKNHMNRSLLTSWKSENDPSPGDFHVAFSSESPPQFFIWKGLKPYWRSGLWDKSKFIGISEMSETYKSQYMITLDDPNQGIISITFREVDGCIFSNLVISSTGELNSKCFVTSRGWKSTWHAPETRSKIIYGTCGPFGVFKGSEELTCSCLKGFVPMSPQEWSTGNWARGCRRRVELHCESNSTTSHQNSQSDGFLKMSNLKLPDFSIFMETSIADTLCMQWCLKNCSCIAYAFVKGIGCLVWDRDLIDMLEFSSGGQDLFVRLDHSELGEHYPLILIISLVSLSSFIILIAAAFSLYMWRPYQKLIERDANNSYRHKMSVEQLLVEKEPLNLPMYDLDSILLATNNFSSAKKLGQGGYGPVYKGKLADGKDVAIKRLSSNSGQGIEEFRNEIKLISKLQHRNLVKIVGCCIDKEEKILIYEFMPNKSLDTYLFDQTNRTELDWHQRFNIILGIARGILYLHRDSCLRVIHRDLKASNILLDKKMNPKISDFGLARMFEGTLDLINTFRVVGTLGYMSPEYALSGLFSEKSDIFSFGVLLLEIISGKKITSFHYNEEYLGLVSYAWQSWCENGGLSMIDEALSGSISLSQATRCVNIGLLCVQDHAADRPSISAVVSMLSDDNAILSQPNKPMFFFQSVLRHHAEPEGRCVLSINQVTESILEGR